MLWFQIRKWNMLLPYHLFRAELTLAALILTFDFTVEYQD